MINAIVLDYLARYGDESLIQKHLDTYDIDHIHIISILLKYSFYDLVEIYVDKFEIDISYDDNYIYNCLYRYCDIDTIKRFIQLDHHFEYIDEKNTSLYYASKHNKDVFIWMLNNCSINHKSKYNTFGLALFECDLEHAKYLYNNLDIDISYMKYFCISCAIRTHEMKIMKWLFSLYNPSTSHYTLMYACQYDFLKCAKYLVYNYKEIKLNTRKNIFFRKALDYNSCNVLRWMKRFYPKHNIIIRDNVVLHLRKLRKINIEKNCPICDDKALIVTSCGHCYCFQCYDKMEDTCFYCRQKYGVKFVDESIKTL